MRDQEASRSASSTPVGAELSSVLEAVRAGRYTRTHHIEVLWHTFRIFFWKSLNPSPLLAGHLARWYGRRAGGDRGRWRTLNISFIFTLHLNQASSYRSRDTDPRVGH